MPTVQPIHISLAVTSAAALVRVPGEDLGPIPALRETLDSAVALRPIVIADLTHVNTADSLGLGMLIRARNATRRRGGDVLLVVSCQFAATVLHIQRMQHAFRTFATVPQAITAASGAVRA